MNKAVLLARLERTKDDPTPLTDELLEAASAYVEESVENDPDDRWIVLLLLSEHKGAPDELLAKVANDEDEGYFLLASLAQNPACGPLTQDVVLASEDASAYEAVLANASVSAEKVRTQYARGVSLWELARSANFPDELRAEAFGSVQECYDDCLCARLAGRRDLTEAEADAVFSHERSWSALVNNTSTTKEFRRRLARGILARGDVASFSHSALGRMLEAPEAEAFLASGSPLLVVAGACCPDLSVKRQLELVTDPVAAPSLATNEALAPEVQRELVKDESLHEPLASNRGGLVRDVQDAIARGPHLRSLLWSSAVSRELVTDLALGLESGRTASALEAVLNDHPALLVVDDLPVRLLDRTHHYELLDVANTRGVDPSTVEELAPGWTGSVGELLRTALELGPASPQRICE